MKSRLAASMRSTSDAWVFCYPTAPPIGSVIVNITIAIAATIASNTAATRSFFGPLIESLVGIDV